MNSDDFNMNNVYSLSNSILFDRETDEIIVTIDRITLSFSIEEFSLLTKEFETAIHTMRNMIMLGSHYIQQDDDQEIN